MERLRRRPTDEALPAPLPDVAARHSALEEAPPEVPQTVQVVWGPIVERMMLVGTTVAEARALLREPFHIAPQVAARVNGRPVGPEHRLAAGETLEFRREFGEKG
jgi:hypothetical protein